MQRIIDPTASATLPAPPALTGTTGYFTGGVPGISAATRLRYWFMNMLQEELMSILAAAGVTPDLTGTAYNQVLLSIETLIGAGAVHGAEAFTSTGSFTVPAAVKLVRGRVWGAGGGTGGCAAGAASAGAWGGGYSEGFFTVVPGAVIPITVGAGGVPGSGTGNGGTGGTSSFGSFCSATGGSGSAYVASGYGVVTGSCGSGSGGQINLTGNVPMFAGTAGSNPFGGAGGSSGLGNGGGSLSFGAGTYGPSPGGGAGGASGSSGGAAAGNGGGTGLVILDW